PRHQHSFPTRRSSDLNSWAALAGLRFNYMFTPQFGAYVHVDYVQALGSKFDSKESRFTTEEFKADAENPITATTEVIHHGNHYLDRKSTRLNSSHVKI